MVLAGGRGRRLAPLTNLLPKPLVPVGDRPILDILIRQLARDGIGEVVVSLGHLGQLVQAYVETSGLRDLLPISFVSERQPLGTAGALSLIEGDDPLLVVNGDVLTDADFGSVVEAHRCSGAAMTVAIHRREFPVELGVVHLDASGAVTALREKPVEVHDCAMGINVYGPEALAVARRGGPIDFPDVVDALLGGGLGIHAHRIDSFWCDIGRADDHARAEQAVLDGIVVLPPTTAL